jgi:hypothetical protein
MGCAVNGASWMSQAYVTGELLAGPCASTGLRVLENEVR